MAILNIVKQGDPTLRKNCRVVTEITPRILNLLDDMVETMRDANGVGLAAPQVGILRRIVVVECTPGEVYEMINPTIVEMDGSQVGTEGCLSLPGKVGIVERPERVTVEATDRHGNRYSVTGEGLLARCFCHELDHLDGVLYCDVADRMLTNDEIRELYSEDDEDEDE